MTYYFTDEQVAEIRRVFIEAEKMIVDEGKIAAVLLDLDRAVTGKYPNVMEFEDISECLRVVDSAKEKIYFNSGHNYTDAGGFVLYSGGNHKLNELVKLPSFIHPARVVDADVYPATRKWYLTLFAREKHVKYEVANALRTGHHAALFNGQEFRDF